MVGSLAKFSCSEQKQGIAEPFIVVNLIKELLNETIPNCAKEEITAYNICAIAFANEFLYNYQIQIKFQSIL